MSNPDALVDTSVAIALTVARHEAHQRTMDALEGQRLGLAGHAYFETFSVLTRLPPPARRRPEEVLSIMNHNFPESRFLSDRATKALANELAELGVAGGSVYDALVGAAAAHHGIVLISRDQRAEDLYRRVGADSRVIA